MNKAQEVFKRIILVTLVTLVAVGVAVLAACGAKDGDYPGGKWTLEWKAGGGIMPQSWKLTLDNSGKITTTSLRREVGPNTLGAPKLTSREGTVQPAEVTRLRNLMRDANLEELSKRKLDPMCMDCYTTTIDVKSGDTTYHVAYFPEEQAAAEKLFDAVYDLYKSFEPA